MGLLFAFSIYYQKICGYSPLEAGLAFLPMTAMVAVGGLISSRAVEALGARRSMCGAFALYAAGSVGMTFATQTTDYWPAVIPLLAIGLASGFISPAATSPALGTVAKERAGVAAAVLNSARQTGSSLGVAVFGTLIASLDSFERALHFVLAITAVAALLAAMGWWYSTPSPPVLRQSTPA